MPLEVSPVVTQLERGEYLQLAADAFEHLDANTAYLTGQVEGAEL